MRLLYVEDDEVAAGFVTKGLATRGFEVEVAGDARSGIEHALGGDYDVIVLDVMLPDGDGFAVLRELREAGRDTPVLFLSARAAASDRIRGLELGADDYLPKPFAFAELVARIHALARRRREGPPVERFVLCDLVLDPRRRTVERGGQPIVLTRRQFDILEYLFHNQGHVVSREMILESVWGHGFETQSNLIEVHVNGLRSRIDREFSVPLLHTVRGFGYVLADRTPAPRE